MTTRTLYEATFLYPGAFFSEETVRPVTGYVGPEPTLMDVLACQPIETEDTYFVKDGWFGVELRKRVEVLYTATESGEADRWVKVSSHSIGRWIVGTEVHVDEIPDDRLVVGGEAEVDGNLILKANLRCNSREPKKDIGVLTRCGNWQLASDWDFVISPEEAARG